MKTEQRQAFASLSPSEEADDEGAHEVAWQIHVLIAAAAQWVWWWCDVACVVHGVAKGIW